MSSDSSSDRRAYVLDVIDDRVDVDGDAGSNANSDLWTSPKRIKQDGTKVSVPFGKDALIDECEAAVDDGDLIRFAGLYAPATPEHLRAIIEAEQDGTRNVLIEKCKRMLSGMGADSA